jgi:hypothetical protein
MVAGFISIFNEYGSILVFDGSEVFCVSVILEVCFGTVAPNER